ncbi:MAG: hypothetical protein WAM77_07985, partial [Xanthobacteraceae bacterium]
LAQGSRNGRMRHVLELTLIQSGGGEQLDWCGQQEASRRPYRWISNNRPSVTIAGQAKIGG